MDKKLIPEITAILLRFNNEQLVAHLRGGYHDWGDVYTPVKIENFEEEMTWEWISKNYHVSHAFIYEYQDKLNMEYLYDNFVITREDFEKIRKREQIDDRFEILDL